MTLLTVINQSIGVLVSSFRESRWEEVCMLLTASTYTCKYVTIKLTIKLYKCHLLIFYFKLLNRHIPVFKLTNVVLINTDEISELFVNMLLFCQYNAIIQDWVS